MVESAYRETLTQKKRRKTPLNYMLRIMNDERESPERRDRMAVAAAPYCHPKLTTTKPGKKHQQTEAAIMAGVGTTWAKDLEFEDRAN